jgi:dTDP-4-dehydrorhamnose reductase
MLGSKVVETLSAINGYRVIATGRSEVSFANVEYLRGDLTENEFIYRLCSYATYDVVIHCAAEVNLKKAEDEPQHSKKIHVEATERLAKRLNGAMFIYISTDSVFDGITGGYTESDQVKPLNEYARTKMEGERIVERFAPLHYILRTNIYGFQFPPKESLVEWAYKQLKNGQLIKGFTNVYFNPLYTKQLAELIWLFIEHAPAPGIYHAGSDESLSKYAFLLKVIRVLEFDATLMLPAEADYTGVVLKRPYNTFLNTSKLKQSLFMADTSIDSGIRSLAKDIKTNNL